jgi:hypothetical protein
MENRRYGNYFHHALLSVQEIVNQKNNTTGSFKIVAKKIIESKDTALQAASNLSASSKSGDDT